MGKHVRAAQDRGFTLVELLVVVVVGTALLALAIPNFTRFIVNQRLKSVNAQLVTDLQFARSEATSRNIPVYFNYRQTFTQSCYTIFTTEVPGAVCNCTATDPCALATLKEIRTVRIPFSDKVRFGAGGAATTFGFDNVNGGIYYTTSDFADSTITDFVLNTYVVGDTSRMLKTVVSPAGRPSVCSAGATSITGFETCP